MTENDPFAAANMNGAASTSNGTALADRDPFVPTADVDDPFATSSDFRGDFTPSPKLDDLKGRVVVMIPRKLDPNAPDPNNEGKTREVYTVDLYVLDGGPLKFWYKQKGDPEAKDAADREDRLKEFEVENVSATQPFGITGYWVPQAGLIGKLKKCHAAAAPFLGVPGMIPQKPARDKGVTTAAIRAEYAAWVQAGKPSNAPKFAWALDDPTPEQKAIAVQWWKANRSTIAAITTA